MGCIGSRSSSKEPSEVSQYDPDIERPSRDRSCTDIFWLILFIIFLGVWGSIGLYGILKGDIDKLLAPVDSKGKRCGLDAGLEDKTYLVFFDIENCLSPTSIFGGCSTPQVCVKECPTKTINFKHMTEQNFYEYQSKMICTEEVDTSSLTLSAARKYIDANICANTVLQSQPVLSLCVGDLKSLECTKEIDDRSHDANCQLNPSEGPSTLKAIASYVGHLITAWLTYISSMRDEHTNQDIFGIENVVVLSSNLMIGTVMGRCMVNFTAAETAWYLRNITEMLGMEENKALKQVSEVTQLKELSGQIVHDLVESRWFSLAALLVAIVLCFVYILLLRWVVGPVVWVSLIGLQVLLGFCIYLCYKNYVYYKNTATLNNPMSVKGVVQSIFQESITWMVLLVAVAILLVVLLLIVFALRSRINIAIELIREGSKAVTAIKSTILLPLVPWIIQCFVIVYGVVVLIHLWSIGDSVFKVVVTNATCKCVNGYEPGEICKPSEFMEKLSVCYDVISGGQCRDVFCHFTGLESPSYVVWLHLINILCFFWTLSFISGVSDMILARTFSTWYWTQNTGKLPFFALTAGICLTLRYHMGTVALGALIIAIVRTIRVILEYIDKHLKKFDNPFTRCIMCFCKCCCWCLENCLIFINKNAYIMCAMHGRNFCRSARDAFDLIVRNIVRTVIVDKTTSFIFFLSKLLLSIGVGVAVYYLLGLNFVQDLTNIKHLYYNYIPAIVLSCATYLICTIFFNVYEMAVDTLFLCFLEDSEKNDGSPEKPFLMSKNLMRLIGKKNKTH